MKVTLRNGRELCNNSKPYIIAEIGANHNGNIDIAEKLIIEAKNAGADCVKFQSWSKKSLMSNVLFKDNIDFEREIDKCAFSEDNLLKVKEIADREQIDISSSPFSRSEVDFLVDKLNAPFIKIASMDVNNYPFLKYVAQKQVPIVMSTGLSELHEIDKAISTIEDAGNKQIIVLHCASNYPPDDAEVNLNKIKTYMKLYPYPIGFSDHTLGTSIPLASVVFGVSVIEKHFTLDKQMEGWDHAVSANPEEMKRICSESKRIVKALGDYRIKPIESEEQRKAFRRSIVAARQLKAKETITENDILYKRPGSGIEPQATEFVVGRKVKRDYAEDELITWDGLE